MKHTNKIAINILRNEYSDYRHNSWHYDRQYRMLVEAQNLVLPIKNESPQTLKNEFKKELVTIRSMQAHYKCGNSNMADIYDREAKQVERMIKILDIIIK